MGNAVVTQKQYNDSYAAAEAQYEKDKASYAATISGKPTIATGADGVKLVGTTGTPGSIGYYGDMMVDTPVANFPGYHTLTSVTWNDNTSIIGTTTKADHENKYAGDDTTVEYDITDVIHNNGTITLTNVGTDQNGRAVDIKLTFTNTDNAQQHGHYYPSKAFIGRAPDNSIEVDAYGGFWDGPDGSYPNQGVNISNIAFVYHGTDTKIPVFINTLVGDVDAGQQFTSNLGNLIAWSAPDSDIAISNVGNGEVHFLNSNPKDGVNGFDHAPVSTGLMVGASTDFNYWFRGPDTRGPIDPHHPVFEDGVQFNLFGKGASLASTPLPPIQQTATASYHYDVEKITSILRGAA